jgi:hypothetical protein
MTLSRHFEVDATRFRRELLFVCCKSDDPTIDRVRQLHEYVAFTPSFGILYLLFLLSPQHPPQPDGQDAVSREPSTPGSNNQGVAAAQPLVCCVSDRCPLCRLVPPKLVAITFSVVRPSVCHTCPRKNDAVTTSHRSTIQPPSHHIPALLTF